MKIAFLTDLHLPDSSNTVKEDVFDWALQKAIDEKSDLIIGVGDLTSMGTLVAAQRIVKKIHDTGIPSMMTLGNAELRSVDSVRSQVVDVLKTMNRYEDSSHCVALLNSSNGFLVQEDKDRLLALNPAKYCIAVTHYPIEDLADDDRELLKEMLDIGSINTVISGHCHYDSFCRIGKGEAYTLSGLDPDKAIGHLPALSIFSYQNDGRKGIQENYMCSIYGVSQWTKTQRHTFKSLCGIVLEKDFTRGVDLAMEHGITYVMIHIAAAETSALKELSTCLEKIKSDKESGKESLHRSVQIALKISCTVCSSQDQFVEALTCLALYPCVTSITMPIPRLPHKAGLTKEALVCEASAQKSLMNNPVLDMYADCLRPLIEKGIAVHFENACADDAANQDDAVDQEYLGDSPLGANIWVKALRHLLCSTNIGLSLNVGYARTNKPYSSYYNISQWYADSGDFIYGYQLSQARVDGQGKLVSRHHIDRIFGPLISFASFFISWNKGQINHAPIFFDMTVENALASIKCFHDYVDADSVQKTIRQGTAL